MSRHKPGNERRKNRQRAERRAYRARKRARARTTMPFCRRTSARHKSEWICGDHWRMIPKARRRVWGRLRKRWRRYGPEAGVHFDVRWWRVWDRLKREAIERAAGI